MGKSSKEFCGRCTQGTDRVRGACSACGKPDRVLDHHQVCKWCRRYSRRQCVDCGRTPDQARTIGPTQLCDHCTLRRALDHIIPAQPAGHLAPLRPVILAAEPLTTGRWLARHADLLTALDQGRTSLDHATLDTLPHPKAVGHLRALLISAEILTPDPTGPIRRLENNLDQLLAELDQPHRRIIAGWIRWQVLPPLRQRAADGLELTNSVANARNRIERTIAFLTTLQARGRTLNSITQHDIDDWFAGPGAARWNTRPFLAWAHKRKHLPQRVQLPPASYIGTRTAPADPEERWTTATRLLTDDTLDPADRVAGLLIVLYAQTLSRITTLTRNDITSDGDGVQLRLGVDPIDLPEPLASLIQTLPIKRREGTAENLPNPWLFPGQWAGTHIHAVNLSDRLRRIGIEPRRMRLAAAEQLSREIPPAMLSGVLGLRTATIAKQSSQSGGNWAKYAGARG